MNELRPEDLLRKLGDTVVPVEDAAKADERRARVVRGLESTLRGVADARAEERRRARVVGVFLLAASVLLAAGFGWRETHRGATAQPAPLPAEALRIASASGTVVRVHDGTLAVVPEGDARLDRGDELTTAPGAEARVAMPSGANVQMAASTKLRVSALSAGATAATHAEELGLDVGRVAVQVPKLGAGESFRVRTPDCEIVVHGTAFLISVDEEVAAGTPHTKLSVSDGTVSVTYAGVETQVHAGEEWPTKPTSTTISTSTTTSNATSIATPTVTPRATGRPLAKDASTLAEQNRLLQQALDARRSGDDARAVKLVDALLARYPSSPLAQEAHVARFRALGRLGDTEGAVAEARRYLAAYPDGFARDEAKSVVLAP